MPISGTARMKVWMPGIAASGRRSRATIRSADTPPRSSSGFRLMNSRPVLTTALPKPPPTVEATLSTPGSAWISATTFACASSIAA